MTRRVPGKQAEPAATLQDEVQAVSDEVGCTVAQAMTYLALGIDPRTKYATKYRIRRGERVTQATMVKAAANVMPYMHARLREDNSKSEVTLTAPEAVVTILNQAAGIDTGNDNAD